MAYSGTGKSSLLSKILGLEHSFTVADGEIYYPVASRDEIVALPQIFYAYKDITLLEAILYPRSLTSEELEGYREQVVDLMREIGLSEEKVITKLDDIDRANNLSGGEKRMIWIISAILKQPKILVLDESFNDMSANYRCIAQTMIQKYLPGIMKISIDHNIVNNHGFYDHILDFGNQTITITEAPEVVLHICDALESLPTPVSTSDSTSPEFTGIEEDLAIQDTVDIVQHHDDL